jgi:hypothetical protein
VEKHDRPILFVDLAGSEILADYDRHLLIDLTQQMMELLAANVEHFAAWGDSAMVVFRSGEELFQAMQGLAIWWRGYPEEVEPLPEGVGLRGAAHVGEVTTVYDRRSALVGSGVTIAGRLAPQAPLGCLLLTPQARKALEPWLRAEKIYTQPRLAYARGSTPIQAHELRLDVLSQSPARQLIQFAAPTDLLLFLASQPEDLFRVTPRRFEELMAELLTDFGYDVHLTKQTRDHGIDIIAVGRSTPLGLDERYLIQCKRNAPNNRVGVSVVRELLGVGVHEPNTGLMIVTTSTFSNPAQQLALKEWIRWRLHLRDYNDISHWLKTYAHKRGAQPRGA